jgi:hypothetical protein
MVRVFGTIREFGNNDIGGGSRYIQVFNVDVIRDFNEVTYHMLDVIYVHLQRTQVQPVS